jgi:hypothetical protein
VDHVLHDSRSSDTRDVEARALLTRELAWQLLSRRVPTRFASPPTSPTQHDMSTHSPARPYRLYPAYYFGASPTYDAWVKLTIADVQALRSEPEFPGNSWNMMLYFAADSCQHHISTFISTILFDTSDLLASL